MRFRFPQAWRALNKAGVLLGLLTGLLLLALLAGTGCGGARPPLSPARPPAPSATPVAATFQTPFTDGSRLLTDGEAADYVGDRACAPCHGGICRAYARTRHANTLKAVNVKEQGANFRLGTKIEDPSLGYAYRPGIEGGKCVIVGENKARRGALPADYVIGTGRNAFTYLSAERPDAWVDLRLSYYTGAKRWDYTPMQKPGDRLFTRAAGIVQAGPMLPACLSCHITYLRAGAQGPDIAQSHIGIGCERCHGPGRAHIEAFRQNRSAGLPASLQMEDFHRASPERINHLCGMCHHNEDNSQPGAFKTENGLARFQGVALARSRCFQVSKTLSCVTCHNPHQNTSSDTRENDAVCLRCHTASTTPKTATSAPPSKTCPVNPRAGCTDCHMPKQTIATIPYAKYRNHWIKVWTPASPSH